MLGQRRRRWSSIEPTLDEYAVFVGTGFHNISPRGSILELHHFYKIAAAIMLILIRLMSTGYFTKMKKL